MAVTFLCCLCCDVSEPWMDDYLPTCSYTMLKLVASRPGQAAVKLSLVPLDCAMLSEVDCRMRMFPFRDAGADAGTNIPTCLRTLCVNKYLVGCEIRKGRAKH